MKTRLQVTVFTIAMVAMAAPCVSAKGFFPFRRFWGAVLVSTDTTRVGRTYAPPSRENPVYYLGTSLGCKLGSAAGDDLPEEAQMTQFVANVLAKQGYLGAIKGEHEPTLFLVLQWGWLQPELDDLGWFLGYHSRDDIAAPSVVGGGGAEGLLQSFRSREIEEIRQTVKHPIYGIIVTAFDFKSASTPNPIVLWQTRIALPSNGKSMSKALPVMIVAAGPAIGRPSNKMTLWDADAVREGRVELGELKVIGVVGEPSGTEETTAKKD